MAKKLRILDLSALDIDGSDVIVTEADIAQVYNYIPPSALTMSVRDTSCAACGATHRAILGIFLEFIEKSGTRRLERCEGERMQNYSYLPRRMDFAPQDTVPICPVCWHFTPLFEAAFPDKPKRGIENAS